jgi:hypothetical protein
MDAEPLKEKKAEAVLKALKKIHARYLNTDGDLARIRRSSFTEES